MLVALQIPAGFFGSLGAQRTPQFTTSVFSVDSNQSDPAVPTLVRCSPAHMCPSCAWVCRHARIVRVCKMSVHQHQDTRSHSREDAWWCIDWRQNTLLHSRQGTLMVEARLSAGTALTLC